jgi:hypothetical protein
MGPRSGLKAVEKNKISCPSPRNIKCNYENGQDLFYKKKGARGQFF